MPGPYIARNFRHTGVIGSGGCEELVQALTGAPQTALWREGMKISRTVPIQEGTAIATFTNGFYRALPLRSHAALFVRLLPAGDGIEIFDQSRGKRPGLRQIYFGRPASAGAANMPEKFSVIA